MWSREKAIINIFNKHNKNTIYISPTGYISRAIYEIFPNNKNILYMQGSMGLSLSIGLGIALNTHIDVVAISGDASFLMHLGVTHTIRDCKLNNLFIYILDNGCHESVGGDKCSPLNKKYISINKIYKINTEGKKPRIKLSPLKNKTELMEVLKNQTLKQK
jgi:thiamine pyrophosphate-dependent acetolactate synthase large subunit-like protein